MQQTKTGWCLQVAIRKSINQLLAAHTPASKLPLVLWSALACLREPRMFMESCRCQVFNDVVAVFWQRLHLQPHQLSALPRGCSPSAPELNPGTAGLSPRAPARCCCCCALGTASCWCVLVAKENEVTLSSAAAVRNRGDALLYLQNLISNFKLDDFKPLLGSKATFPQLPSACQQLQTLP